MLWPARWLGRPTSPRRCFAPTGAPVYYRACPARSLLQAKSVITTRPNHLLPRRDFHPLACQRTKAAPEGREGTELKPRTARNTLKEKNRKPRNMRNTRKEKKEFKVCGRKMEAERSTQRRKSHFFGGVLIWWNGPLTLSPGVTGRYKTNVQVLGFSFHDAMHQIIGC